MSEAKYPNVKVKINLAGPQGNAFAVLGICSAKAREKGVSEAEIKAFSKEAMSGDYGHLLRVCSKWFDFKG